MKPTRKIERSEETCPMRSSWTKAVFVGVWGKSKLLQVGSCSSRLTWMKTTLMGALVSCTAKVG